MSYSFDTLERAWQLLADKLPEEVRHGEVASRFGFLLSELHEANHRLNDAINKDGRVTRHAQALDNAISKGQRNER